MGCAQPHAHYLNIAKLPQDRGKYSCRWGFSHLAMVCSAGDSGMLTSHMQMWQSCARDVTRYDVAEGAASFSKEAALALSTSMSALLVDLPKVGSAFICVALFRHCKSIVISKRFAKDS